MRPARPLALAALLSTLLLSGCVAPPPAIQPPPEPSTAPIFATDEEALAAATDAYAAYLKMSDLIAHDGGANATRMAPVVTDEWLVKEVETFGELLGSDLHQEGSSTYRSIDLQQVDQDSGGRPLVTVYACTDWSQTKILNATDVDVTPTDRISLMTVEVSFSPQETDYSKLLVAGIEPWPGVGIC